MTACTFAGHREVYQAGVERKIEETICQLLQTDQKFVFYTGGMGSFDDLCSSAVRTAKRHHSDLDISLSLVLPYMSNRLNTDKEYYSSQYDEVIIPAELADIHYRAAIKKRNRWMVDQAAHVIAYVYRDFGGAHDTMKYARRKGKYVINLAENVESHI